MARATKTALDVYRGQPRDHEIGLPETGGPLLMNTLTKHAQDRRTEGYRGSKYLGKTDRTREARSQI